MVRVLAIFLLVSGTAFADPWWRDSSPQLPPNQRENTQTHQAPGSERTALGAEKEIANYTWWLAVFTAVLSVSTIGLWISGILAASRQAKDTKDAIAQAVRSADAAEKGLAVTQRAYAITRLQPGLNLNGDEVLQYIIACYWINIGLTPALDVRVVFMFEEFAVVENHEPLFYHDMSEVTPTVLGPKMDCAKEVVISVHKMRQLWTMDIEIYLWARVEYRTVFEPNRIQHYEQCFLLDLIHEPSFKPPANHPAYTVFRTYGPQNTIGSRHSPEGA